MTTNIKLRHEYRTEIIRTYNEIAQLLIPVAESNATLNILCTDSIKPIFEKLKRAFSCLKLRYQWPSSALSYIEHNGVIELEETTETDDQQVQSSGHNLPTTSSKQNLLNLDTVSENNSTSDTVSENISNLDTESGRNSSLIDSEEFNNSRESEYEDTVAMVAQTNKEFLKLVSPIINYKFNGDPLKLESFLADVDLVIELAENDDTKKMAVKFIKSKLEGRALECLPEEVTQMDHITSALKTTIKPESSKVIEGKIMALRIDKGNLSKFNEQAEKLSEALRRSLIIEGISKKKAEEMTITKTVELCRKTARSEIVKSVISATPFATPAEVIAKFITESEVARREYKESESAKNSKFNKNKNYGQQKNNGNKFNKYGQSQNNQRQGGNYRHQNRNNNSNTRNYQGNNGNRNNVNNNRREATIRIVSGNGQTPSGDGQSQNQGDLVQIPFN